MEVFFDVLIFRIVRDVFPAVRIAFAVVQFLLSAIGSNVAEAFGANGIVLRPAVAWGVGSLGHILSKSAQAHVGTIPVALWVLQKRKNTKAVKLGAVKFLIWVCVKSSIVEHCRENVNPGDGFGTPYSFFHARAGNNKWNAQRLFPQRTFEYLFLFADVIAVVGGEDNEGVVGVWAGIQCIQHLAELGVDIGDAGQIGLVKLVNKNTTLCITKSLVASQVGDLS